MLELLRTEVFERPERSSPDIRPRWSSLNRTGSAETRSANPFAIKVLDSSKPINWTDLPVPRIDICEVGKASNPYAKPENLLVLNGEREIPKSDAKIRDQLDEFEREAQRPLKKQLPFTSSSIRTIQNWEVVVDEVTDGDAITFGRNLKGGERLKITVPLAEIDTVDHKYIVPGTVLHIIAGMQRRNGSSQRSSLIYVRRHPPRESIDGLVAASLLRKLTEKTD